MPEQVKSPHSSPPKGGLKGCLAFIGFVVLGALILVGIRSIVGEASPVADITAQRV